MKSFQRMVVVPFGTVTVLACLLATVASQQPGARKIDTVFTSSSQNQTFDNTQEIVKRVGEFASRALWVRKGKFVLPTGTILTLAPKITVPAFRRKAFNGGLNSDFQATWFFYINCDKMGFTHDMHPFPFDRPPFYPFGPLMRPIEGKDGDKKKEEKPVKGSPLPTTGPLDDPVYPMDPSYNYQPLLGAKQDSGKTGDLVYTFFPSFYKRTGAESKKQPVFGRGNVRKPRSIMDLPPPDKLPGGERAVLLPSIENMMSNFGFEGRGCMLRAICEIHEFPLQEGYGLLGEMIALFFSISQSPYAESHMPEYLKAEEAGRTGNCSAYKSQCAKSLFKWEVERKRLDHKDVDTNEIPGSPLRSKFQDDEL